MPLTRSYFKMTEIETRKTPEGKMIVTGYAAVFESLSVPLWGFREKIRAGAFKNTISASDNNIRALWNHNRDYVLGSTGNGSLKLKEDDKGLRFELNIADTQIGRDGFVSIERRDVDGMSFSFNAVKQEWDETDPQNVVRTLIEVDCQEISPTAFPAYQDTSISARTAKDDYAEYQESIKRQREQSDNDIRSRMIEMNKRKLNLNLI